MVVNHDSKELKKAFSNELKIICEYAKNHNFVIDSTVIIQHLSEHVITDPCLHKFYKIHILIKN